MISIAPSPYQLKRLRPWRPLITTVNALFVDVNAAPCAELSINCINVHQPLCYIGLTWLAVTVLRDDTMMIDDALEMSALIKHCNNVQYYQ